MEGEKWNVELTENEAELGPLARRILRLMEKAEPDEDGRVLIRHKDAPEIRASSAQAKRIASAVDAITRHLDSAEIRTRASDESSSLRFSKGNDYLILRIEEAVEEVEVSPTQEQKRRPSWTWQNKLKQTSGKLSFRIDSNRRLRGRRQWTETTLRSLEFVVSVVVEEMARLFEKFKQERIAEAEWERERAEKQRQWREAERRREHVETLNKVEKCWLRNIIRAAE
jgi:hypothetical protein